MRTFCGSQKKHYCGHPYLLIKSALNSFSHNRIGVGDDCIHPKQEELRIHSKISCANETCLTTKKLWVVHQAKIHNKKLESKHNNFRSIHKIFVQ